VAKSTIANSGLSVENRFANLFDFSLDIQRHEMDLEFVYYGGRIHYALDENIFELFVRPFARARCATRDALSVDREADADEADSGTARQTALLCAEALFLGRLPGQVRGEIYLSEWHRWELLSRLNELLLENAESMSCDTDLADYLADKAAILNTVALPDNPVSDDDHLATDLAELEKLPSVRPTALLPFWRNRSLVAMISRNETVEPLQQLKRLLSSEMQQRLQGIVSLRRPVGEELDRVTASARRWTAALRREVTARDAHRRAPTKRSKTSFENDGRTLALVEWVAGRLGPRDRLVLVTGDAALYDAYRRAAEEEPRSRRLGARPFLLRRPAQYAPLFTSNIETAEFDPHLKLFYSVQQAVELPIAPLRMASISAGDRASDALSRRNSLTLRPLHEGRFQGKPYIHDVWGLLGRDYDVALIAELEGRLDQNERILNGFTDDLLAKRISPQEREILLNAPGGGPEEQRRAFQQYIEEVIGALMASAVVLWKPIAERFLKRALVSSLSKHRRYVPVVVNVAGAKAISALDAVNFVIGTEDLSPEAVANSADDQLRLDSAFDVFLSSAAVALVGNDWRMAEHFSEVAINSFSHLAALEDVSLLEGYEAYYLCALAKRFRLGQIPLDDTGSGFKAGRRIFDRIGNLKARAGRLNTAPMNAIINLRTEVEYAAASLFFCIFCLEQSQRMAGLDGESEVRESCVTTHRLAGEALEQCFSIYHSSDFEPVSPDLHGSGLQIIRAQFLINIAAWTLLAPLVRRVSVGSFEHRNDLRAVCESDLPALQASLGTARTELFMAEVLAFKIAQGIEVAKSREQLQELARAAPPLDLEIDRVWFDTILKHWASPQ